MQRAGEARWDHEHSNDRTLHSFILAIIGAEYILKWLPKGTHDYRRFLQSDEIRCMIKAHDLDFSELTGLSFNLVISRLRLSGYTSVNYMLLAAKRPRARQKIINPKRT